MNANDMILKIARNFQKKAQYEKSAVSYSQLLNSQLFDKGNDKIDLSKIELDILLEFLQVLYLWGRESNTLLPSDADEDEDSDDDDNHENQMEYDEEEINESEEEENGETKEDETKNNTKYFQFGLEEEDIVEMSGDEKVQSDEDEEEEHEEEEMDTHNLSLFTLGNIAELYEDKKYIFDNILIVSNELINYCIQETLKSSQKTNVSLKLAELFCLNGDVNLEIENFTDSILNYKEAIKILHASLSKQPENMEKIVDIHLKLCATYKWIPDLKEEFSDCLHKSIELVEQRIQTNQEDSASDKKIVQELKEDLLDLEESQQDIRQKHPEFDRVLKRALGQLTTFEESDLQQGQTINDLSRLVQKKRKK